MQATMTILGLVQYDNTLFDGIVLPGTLVKDTLIANLVTQLECFQVLYPSALVMKTMIGYWSAMMQGVWKKRYDTTVLEYDILRNYDITKEILVESLGETHVNGRGSDTSETQKYPSTGTLPENVGKVTNTLGSGSDTNGSGKVTTKDHEFGDASLRTTQQVLEEERRVAEYNIYETIIDDFKRRFCLMIYE